MIPPIAFVRYFDKLSFVARMFKIVEMCIIQSFIDFFQISIVRQQIVIRISARASEVSHVLFRACLLSRSSCSRSRRAPAMHVDFWTLGYRKERRLEEAAYLLNIFNIAISDAATGSHNRSVPC